MTLALPIRWVQPGADPGEASEPAGPGEWRAVPAIERAAGDIELTAPARAFVGGLASRQSTAASPGSLRPGRSLDAPAGLVRGIARVLDGGRRGGPELVQAPRERTRHGTGGSWSVGDADDTPEAVAADVGTEEDAPVAVEAVAPPALDLPRARPVAAVARAEAPSAPKPLLRASETAPLPPAVGRVLPPPAPSPSVAVHAEAEPGVFEETAAPDPLPPAEPSHHAPPLPPEFRPRRVRGTFAAPPPLAAPAQPPAPQSQDADVSDTASPSLAAPAPETPQPGSQNQVAELPRTEPLPAVARVPELPQPGSQNDGGKFSAPLVTRRSEPPQLGSQSQVADVALSASPPLVARASETPQPGSQNQIAELPHTGTLPVVARAPQPPRRHPQNEATDFSPPAAPTSEPPQPRSQNQVAAVQRSAPGRDRTPLSDESSLSAVRPGARPRATPQPGSQNEVADVTRPVSPPLVARAPESPQRDSKNQFAEVTHPAAAPLVARTPESPQPGSQNQFAEATHPAAPPLVARAPESPQPGSQNHVGATGAAAPARDRNPLSDESSRSSLRPGTRPRATPQPDSKNRIPEVTHTEPLPLVARTSENPQGRSQSQVTVGSAGAPGRDRKPLSDESSLSAVRAGARPGATAQPGSKNQIAESPHMEAATIAARASMAATPEPTPSTAGVERAESPLPIVQARLLDGPVPASEHQAPEASHDAIPSSTETTAVVSAQPTALAPSTPDTTTHVETVVSARPSPPVVQRRATSGELAPIMPARAAEPHRGESPAARALEGTPAARISTAARRDDERATNAAPTAHDPVVQRASEPVQHRSVQPAGELETIVRARIADAPDVTPAQQQQQQRAVRMAPVEARVARAAEQSAPVPVVPTREVAALPRESAPLPSAADVQRREEVSVQPTAPATAEPTRVVTPAPAETTEQQPRVGAERSVALPHPVVTARVAEVQRVARSTPVAERRPGLDFHAALSAPPVSPRTPAVISRAVVTAGTARVAELPARRPGLDLHAGLAETRIVPASFVESPVHRPVHQVAPAMVATAPAYEPAPAPPAPVAALPSPPTPPPAVQRVTSSFAPEDTNEDRVLATSDDELEELAGRLYDHIRSRFRAELLIDRERAGLLADRY